MGNHSQSRRALADMSCEGGGRGGVHLQLRERDVIVWYHTVDGR